MRVTPRTTQSPVVTGFFTAPVTPSMRYRWFQPSRSDIQTTSRPSAMSRRYFLLEYVKKVFGSSEITARAAPVEALTSMTRYTWWPRWLYSNVTAELSLRHCSADSSYGFGKSAWSIASALRLPTSNRTGCSRSSTSPGLA